MFSEIWLDNFTNPFLNLQILSSAWSVLLLKDFSTSWKCFLVDFFLSKIYLGLFFTNFIHSVHKLFSSLSWVHYSFFLFCLVIFLNAIFLNSYSNKTETLVFITEVKKRFVFIFCFVIWDRVGCREILSADQAGLELTLWVCRLACRLWG